MSLQVHQCELCRSYTDYECTLVDIVSSMGPNYGLQRWCDDCVAKIRRRATVAQPVPFVGDAVVITS